MIKILFLEFLGYPFNYINFKVLFSNKSTQYFNKVYIFYEIKLYNFNIWFTSIFIFKISTSSLIDAYIFIFFIFRNLNYLFIF